MQTLLLLFPLHCFLFVSLSLPFSHVSSVGVSVLEFERVFAGEAAEAGRIGGQFILEERKLTINVEGVLELGDAGVVMRRGVFCGLGGFEFGRIKY